MGELDLMGWKIRTLMRPSKRKGSANRQHLRNAVYEGIPATIIANLIGGPLMTGYLLFLGANPSQIGVVLAIPPLANLVQIAVAMYMQRISNRKMAMLITGVSHRVIWLLTGLIPYLLAKEWWVHAYIPILLLSFIMASANSVIWSSLIADFVPAQVRGRYFGLRNTICWAIGSVALLIGGQILDRYPGQLGFAILFAISAVCLIWNGYAYWQYPNPPFEKSQAPTRLHMLQKPFQDRAFLIATLFIAVFVLIQNIAVPLFSFVMLDVLGIGYRWMSMITTIQMIVMMLSYYYWGNLNARFSTRSLLMWVFPIIALSCVAWGALAFVPVFAVLVVSHVLLGFGTGGYNLLVFNFTIGDTPKADRPMFIAVFSAVTGFAGFLGPVLGGMIYEQVGHLSFWIQSYGIPLTTGLALLLFAFGFGPSIFNSRRIHSM